MMHAVHRAPRHLRLHTFGLSPSLVSAMHQSEGARDEGAAGEQGRSRASPRRRRSTGLRACPADGPRVPRQSRLHCPHRARFSMLDEACSLQNSTEAAFFSRVAASCGRDRGFFAQAWRRRLRRSEGFIVRHFAGDVCYVSRRPPHPAEREGGGSGADKQALIQASADTWLVRGCGSAAAGAGRPSCAAPPRRLSPPCLPASRATAAAAPATAVVRRFAPDLARDAARPLADVLALHTMVAERPRGSQGLRARRRTLGERQIASA